MELVQRVGADEVIGLFSAITTLMNWRSDNVIKKIAAPIGCRDIKIYKRYFLGGNAALIGARSKNCTI